MFQFSRRVPLFTSFEVGELRNTANIYEIAQLEELVAWGSLIKRPAAITLQLSDVEKEDSARWQTLINKQLRACGCAEGAVLLVVSACGYIAYRLLFVEEITSLRWGVIGTGIGISFAAALIGKLAGLARAQMALARLVRRLKAGEPPA